MGLQLRMLLRELPSQPIDELLAEHQIFFRARGLTSPRASRRSLIVNKLIHRLLLSLI